MAAEPVAQPLVIGRYVLQREIGVGGMASVYLGRAHGDAGFTRLVAIKRLHPQYAKDAEFADAMIDEARIAARVSHANVVQVLDVVAHEGELLIVMELLKGETLARLLKLNRGPVSPEIAAKVALDALAGLHAAHEAKNEMGVALELVHRDVSPQNVIVGVDGTARLIDFGVAKAIGRMQQTRDGRIKGKLGYFAPETIKEGVADRRVDVYAAGVLLWEMLTGRRLFSGENELQILAAILNTPVQPPSAVVPGIPQALDRIVLRAVTHDLGARYPTAEAMADDLDHALAPAGARRVADWVKLLAAGSLAEREAALSAVATTPAGYSQVTHSDSGIVNRVLDETARIPTDDVSETQRRDAAAPTSDDAPPTVLERPVDSQESVDTQLVPAQPRPSRNAPTLVSEGAPPASAPPAPLSHAPRTVPATPLAVGALAPTEPALTPKIPDEQAKDYAYYQEARVAWLEGRTDGPTAHESRPPPVAPGRSRAWLAIPGVLLVVGAAALVLGLAAERREPDRDVPPAPTSLADPDPELEQPPKSLEPEQPPDLREPEQAEAPAVEPQVPSPRPPAPTPPRSTPPPPVVPAPPGPSTAKPADQPSPIANCDPPYWLDAKRVKRWKPECIQ